MRYLAIAVAVVGSVAVGCGSGGQVDRGTCRPAVSGGSSAQRAVVTSVLCAMGEDVIQHVSIHGSPRNEPAGSVGLVIIASVPPEPASPKGPRAARARFADDRATWYAAIASGAIRDRSRRAQLPHVVSYSLLFHPPGAKPTLQGQGRIALPGWGDPEGQGSFPPATLGHGAPSHDSLQQRLTAIASQTHTRVSLGWGRPLAATPYVIITTANPRRLLAGPITRYLDALEFQNARYDGVLIAVFDAKHQPVWAATTADRIGTRGCSTYSAEAGKSNGPFPSFNSAGDRACAASGTAFS
jgi:hypothetical protein